MKRLIIAVLLLLTLCGCSKAENMYPYPCLIYRPSYWSLSRVWKIEDGHKLNDGHSYDIIDTEDGYDVVVHFVEED